MATSFDYDELIDKTNAELREIARNMGITGVTKARKSIIIDRILEAQDEEDWEEEYDDEEVEGDVDAVRSEMTSVREPAGDISTKIRVSCGGSSDMFSVVGKTVGAVSEILREALNIDEMAQGLVNGKPVQEDYTLKSQDVLEFIKPAGRKG